MKLTKVLSLVLTLALLIVGAAATTASAEDAPKVEITSKNLSYDSNISILFAVKTANTDAAPKLNVYTKVDGELTLKKTIDATFTPANSEAEVGYADAYIFLTDGIVAKALDTQIYVQAVAGEATSAMERYSVVEYCHEMNTKKSTTDYNDIINYGTRVQKMLAADGKFSGAYASDSYYVTAEGGTLDGTYDSGIYLAGDKVYPQADDAQGWIASDAQLANGQEYVVKSSVSFTKIVAGVETITIDRTKANGMDGPSYTIGSCGGGKFGHDEPIRTNSASGVREDKVYGVLSQVDVAKSSKAGYQAKYYLDNAYKSSVTADEADAFEFSADIKFVADAGVTSTMNDFVFYGGSNSSIMVTTSADGITFTNSSDSEETVTVDVTASEYNHIAFRFLEKDGANIIKLYVNGVYAYEFTANAAFGTMSYMRVTMKDTTTALYVDNLFMGLIIQ